MTVTGYSVIPTSDKRRIANMLIRLDDKLGACPMCEAEDFHQEGCDLAFGINVLGAGNPDV